MDVGWMDAFILRIKWMKTIDSKVGKRETVAGTIRQGLIAWRNKMVNTDGCKDEMHGWMDGWLFGWLTLVC